MYKRGIASLLFIQFAFVNFSEQQYSSVPSSPCPDIFQYYYDGASYEGLITTNAPQFGSRAVLQVKLSLRASTSVCKFQAGKLQ